MLDDSEASSLLMFIVHAMNAVDCGKKDIYVVCGRRVEPCFCNEEGVKQMIGDEVCDVWCMEYCRVRINDHELECVFCSLRICGKQGDMYEVESMCCEDAM